MNDHSRLRFFLKQLRRFLPEKTIYETLSSLPEDIFDDDDYLNIPYFNSDDEIRTFIYDNGYDDSQNLISFFMEQYMEHFNEMIDAIFEELGILDEAIESGIDCSCCTI